ncbi:MAG: hypothetical protein KIT60_23115 [Burkholderiaceae bacterium]|jgi:hypothetical protein|nr:hypothetical protein [Burkholderiaceae bacterium]
MHNPQDNAADMTTVADPFAMLINPQAVLQAIEQSGRLGALASRVCRPLDKPLIPKRDSDDPHGYDDRHGEAVSDTELGTIY